MLIDYQRLIESVQSGIAQSIGMLTVNIFAENAQDSAHRLVGIVTICSFCTFITTYCGVEKGHGRVKDVAHGLVVQVLGHVKGNEVHSSTTAVTQAERSRQLLYEPTYSKNVKIAWPIPRQPYRI